MLSPADAAKLQAHLDLNERLLWACKPKPWACFSLTKALFLFGVFWCLMTAMMGGLYLEGAWMEVECSSLLTETEIFWTKIFAVLKVAPFALVGVTLFLHPLWVKLWSRGLIYAVTDKRALRVGHCFAASWHARMLLTPQRIDKPSGVSNLLFLFFAKSDSGHRFLTGFYNVPTAEAVAGEVALCKVRFRVVKA